MSKVVVFENVTLDGVMQAPGRPDEDPRGGFEHGGWSPPYGDEVMGRFAAESMVTTGALVLGRRTYEDFLYCRSPISRQPAPSRHVRFDM
jgi:dihydrofolate reductase